LAPARPDLSWIRLYRLTFAAGRAGSACHQMDPRRAMQEADPSALDGLERRLARMESDLVSLRLPVRFREYAATMQALLRHRGLS
jgi:hypothetical protein